MDPIQLIVTALVAGASNALESTASSAIKDAYSGLKNLIKNRYPEVGVDRLEKKPDSTARKEAVHEDLEDAKADIDSELLQQAQTLLTALQNEPTHVKGVSLDNIKAALAVNISDVQATGTDNVTGVEISNSTFDDELNISGVSASNRPSAPPQSAKPSAQIKILFLAANPLDTDRLQLGEEVRAIDEALRKTEYRALFDLDSHWAVRVDDLQELLLRHDPHIVHFSGHGTSEYLILQDVDGESRPVPGDKIADLFGALNGNTRSIVLNACYSEDQAAAMAKEVDCVVGMSDKITDGAARNFALAFYRGLGYGKSVQEAFKLGCSQSDILDLDEAHKPVLLSRVDPNTIRFADPKV